MDRREFVKVALTASAMGAGNWNAHAADVGGRFGPDQAAIIAQRGVPHAAELADRIWFGLARAGVGPVMRRECTLHSYKDIAELLSLRSNAWLIGITQDATAVLAQAIAATQGSTCALHVHHRIALDVLRHSCTRSSDAEMFSWSERRAAHDTRLGAMYASTLRAGGLPRDQSQAAFLDHVPIDRPSSRLASFLIRL